MGGLQKNKTKQKTSKIRNLLSENNIPLHGVGMVLSIFYPPPTNTADNCDENNNQRYIVCGKQDFSGKLYKTWSGTFHSKY